MSLNPISLSDISGFITLFGLPALELEVFVQLLNVVDNAYLKEKAHG